MEAAALACLACDLLQCLLGCFSGFVCCVMELLGLMVDAWIAAAETGNEICTPGAESAIDGTKGPLTEIDVQGTNV